MLRPEDTLVRTINLETVLTALEHYTDRILTMEFSAGKQKAEVIYFGEHYTMLTHVIRPLISMYQRNNWIVKDVTGNRKLTYILEFSMREDNDG